MFSYLRKPRSESCLIPVRHLGVARNTRIGIIDTRIGTFRQQQQFPGNLAGPEPVQSDCCPNVGMGLHEARLTSGNLVVGLVHGCQELLH